MGQQIYRFEIEAEIAQWRENRILRAKDTADGSTVTVYAWTPEGDELGDALERLASHGDLARGEAFSSGRSLYLAAGGRDDARSALETLRGRKLFTGCWPGLLDEAPATPERRIELPTNQRQHPAKELVESYNAARLSGDVDQFNLVYNPVRARWTNRQESANHSSVMPVFTPHERGRFLVVEAGDTRYVVPAFGQKIHVREHFEWIYRYPEENGWVRLTEPAVVARKGGSFVLAAQGLFQNTASDAKPELNAHSGSAPASAPQTNLVEVYNAARRSKDPAAFTAAFHPTQVSWTNRGEREMDATVPPRFARHDRGRFLLVVEADGTRRVLPGLLDEIEWRRDFEAIYAYPEAGSGLQLAEAATVVKQEDGFVLAARGRFELGEARARAESGDKRPAEPRKSGGGPGVPGMGRRLLAYLMDYFLLLPLGLFATAAPELIDRSLPWWTTLVAMAVTSLYHPLLLMTWHTTVGKYIAGLEVLSLAPTSKYPSWGRVLLRETVGRAASLLLFGLGYWTALSDPLKRAWSDRMACTAVLRRETRRGLRLLFGSLVLAGVVGSGIVGAAAVRMVVAQQKRAAISAEMRGRGALLNQEMAEIQRLVSTPTDSLNELRKNMWLLMEHLDAYDALIKEQQGALKSLTYVTYGDEQWNDLAAANDVFRLRKRTSECLREQARLITGVTGNHIPAETLKRLESLDAEIKTLEAAITSARARKK